MDEVTVAALGARDGDPAAATAFVRATQAEVWRLCAHLARPEVAEDLTQEVYERAFRALARYRGDAPARLWLLSIARRTAVDWVRAARRRRALDARLGGDPVEFAPDPAGAVVLDALLARLAPERRAAFVATQLVGLPYDEAARVCGCPVGTVRSRVARARADLVAMLDTAPERRRPRVAGNSLPSTADL